MIIKLIISLIIFQIFLFIPIDSWQPKNLQQNENDSINVEIEITKILKKRDIASNIAMDDPTSKCRNGGIFSGGRCHCIHPHTGVDCQHFACVNGISVGFRYDPDSLLFSTPCICNDTWKGELCNYKPNEECSFRGEWKNDRCECIGFFFGSSCQYTSRCVEGKMKNGRCICNDGFEGDYCNRIVCAYGTPNNQNKSLSCICPPKYKGRHCDECENTGVLIEPYPVCSFNIRKKKTIETAMELRRKQKKEMKKKIWIVCTCIILLAIGASFVLIVHTFFGEAQLAEQKRREEHKEQRHKLLTNQVRLQKLEEEANIDSIENVVLTVQEERKRRKSEPSILSSSNVKKDAKLTLEQLELLTNHLTQSQNLQLHLKPSTSSSSSSKPTNSK